MNFIGVKEDPIANRTVWNKSSTSDSSRNGTIALIKGLPKETVEELLEVYRFEFEAYGYDPSVYL